MLGATEIAQELQNKLGGLDAATRDAALQTIFGSDAMRAATVLMNSGAEGLKKYTDATNDQEAASRLADSQMSEYSRAIEEMKGSIETAAIAIGGTLAPIVSDVAKVITELVNKFSALSPATQKVITRTSPYNCRKNCSGNIEYNQSWYKARTVVYQSIRDNQKCFWQYRKSSFGCF